MIIIGGLFQDDKEDDGDDEDDGEDDEDDEDDDQFSLDPLDIFRHRGRLSAPGLLHGGDDAGTLQYTGASMHGSGLTSLTGGSMQYGSGLTSIESSSCTSSSSSSAASSSALAIASSVSPNTIPIVFLATEQPILSGDGIGGSIAGGSAVALSPAGPGVGPEVVRSRLPLATVPSSSRRTSPGHQRGGSRWPSPTGSTPSGGK